MAPITLSTWAYISFLAAAYLLICVGIIASGNVKVTKRKEKR